ncbi:MAG: SH3 domain-containing protein [Methylococcales bacterium]|nr:SH3 domain-containing protein [Methylococcales bacterium]
MFSQTVLADRYQTGLDHYDAGNYAKAYCIWKVLADRGHVVAQYSLGWMYANGEGLAVDAKTAIKLWRQSAALGHPDAHFAMALAYTTGEGVKRDDLKAIKWHIEASQLGHEDSQAILYDLITGQFQQLSYAEKKMLQQSWRMLGTSNFINSNRANIRSGPSSKNKTILYANKGDEFVEFRRKGKWLQIGLPNKTIVGWVHSSLIE